MLYVIVIKKEGEEMGKSYTDAQARATKEYLKTLVSISIRVKKEEKDRYNKAAKKAGMSLRSFLLQSMEEKIVKDGLEKK